MCAKKTQYKIVERPDCQTFHIHGHGWCAYLHTQYNRCTGSLLEVSETMDMACYPFTKTLNSKNEWHPVKGVGESCASAAVNQNRGRGQGPSSGALRRFWLRSSLVFWIREKISAKRTLYSAGGPSSGTIACAEGERSGGGWPAPGPPTCGVCIALWLSTPAEPPCWHRCRSSSYFTWETHYGMINVNQIYIEQLPNSWLLVIVRLISCSNSKRHCQRIQESVYQGVLRI